MTIPDDLLMAFADGEVDEATRQRVETAARHDPEVRRRVDEHRRLRATLQHAYGPVLDESVPARLIAAVRQTPMASVDPVPPVTLVAPAPVVQLSERRTAKLAAANVAWLRTWPAAGSLAASILVGVSLGYAAFHRPDGLLRTASDGSVTASGALLKALSTQLSTDRSNDLAATIGLTFRAKSGEYCRTFTLATGNASGLACRERDHWRIEMLAPAGAGGPVADYRMAGSSESPQLRSLVESDMQGEPLTQVEEADARSAGWPSMPR